MKKQPYGSFSGQLRSLRESAGISLRELARRSGVPDTYLGKLEAGKKDDPSWRIVCQIAGALGVSTEAFR